mgnify:CR=1 FL=1
MICHCVTFFNWSVYNFVSRITAETLLLSDADKQKQTSSAKTKQPTALSQKSDVESEDVAETYSDSELKTEERLSMVSTSEKPGKE